MSQQEPIKLIPRNVAALRRGQSPQNAARLVAGNPVSTRLEAGVGNCFPGLECDLRNLERRFFPFLEVDIEGDTTIRVVNVDTPGLQSAVSGGQMPAGTATVYQQIAGDLAASRSWRITQIRGTFGPLGVQSLVVANLASPSTGPNRLPPDAWTAIRLLTEGTEVELTLKRGNVSRTLVGNRARYLDDNGGLAKMFLPGELTQSLCSPWAHDFRDCGCFYWASNHPDIALPPLPTPAPNVPEVNTDVVWERANRNLNTLPSPATSNDPNAAGNPELAELVYYQINTEWQALNFVVEGREIVGPYQPGVFAADKFATREELLTNLRYAAGVELAVVHEYLAAAYSLRAAGIPPAANDDVVAARAELIRIAASEMRHLRAVNDVLHALTVGQFTPALRVAARVPAAVPGGFRDIEPRAATPQAIQDFIDLERPSVSVDGLYSRILATLERDGSAEMRQTIRSIMAEGENHFESFSFIQEWLNRHSPNDYLRKSNLTTPPSGNARHVTLQQRYRDLLERLFSGYTLGIPAGAGDINTARNAMLGSAGIAGAAMAVADAGFLVAFDRIADPRFAPIDHP
jgi:Ferritin-like